MEFKGTKGKWRTYQTSSGNMKVSSDEWIDFAEVEFTHPQLNNKERREECLYNAKLISKAPEMLEMLKECQRVLSNVQSPATPSIFLYREIEQLIKEATEL